MVIDTESSVCASVRRRVLVSVAYEVVDRENRLHAAWYDVVLPGSEDYEPDAKSVSLHGITPAMSRLHGRPLREVMHRFLSYVEFFRPIAVVGHDVVGDMNLLVSEALRCGAADCRSLPPALRTLLCTRMLATRPCGILRGRRLKWPNLDESFRLLVPTSAASEMPALHDARGDVTRCRAILFALLARGLEENDQGSGITSGPDTT